MSTVTSTLGTYIDAHHGAPQTKVAGGLLACAVAEMATRTIVNLGVVLTRGPGYQLHQRNLGINFASTLVWGALAANIVPGFAIIGVASYCFYSCIFAGQGGNEYYSARLCRSAARIATPVTERIWGAVWAICQSLGGLLNHPIGYGGALVGAIIVLYHGPVLIISKITEAVGLTHQDAA